MKNVGDFPGFAQSPDPGSFRPSCQNGEFDAYASDIKLRVAIENSGQTMSRLTGQTLAWTTVQFQSEIQLII